MPFPLLDAPGAPRAIPLATRSCGLASPILLRSELSRTHGRLLYSLRRSGEARIDSRTSRSVVDRLVGRGPEVETDIRRTGGRPGALGHQDPGPCPPWGPNATRCPGRHPSRTFRGTRPRPRAG